MATRLLRVPGRFSCACGELRTGGGGKGQTERSSESVVVTQIADCGDALPMGKMALAAMESRSHSPHSPSG